MVFMTNLNRDIRPGDSWPYGSIHPGRRMTPKKWEFFFYGETYISLDISMSCCTISLCVSIKGQQGSSWSLFRTFTCWTCLKHLVNLANKCKCISIFWPSSPSALDKFNKWKSQKKIMRASADPWLIHTSWLYNVTYLYLVKYKSHRRKKLSHFLGVILRPEWNHPYRSPSCS